MSSSVASRVHRRRFGLVVVVDRHKIVFFDDDATVFVGGEGGKENGG